MVTSFFTAVQTRKTTVGREQVETMGQDHYDGIIRYVSISDQHKVRKMKEDEIVKTIGRTE